MAEDFEGRLRRYRPVGPPAHLRARLLSANEPRRAWPWAAAAAALLVTITLARAGAASLGAAVLDAPAGQGRNAIDELAIALGGDATARLIAETLALQEEVRAQRTPVAPEGTLR